MASLSPALLASRPGAFIDPHRPAEYPVLLGDSLRDTSGAKNQFFNVQYNWKPKNASSKQKAVITKANPQSTGDASYQLTIQESTADSKPFKYAGNVKTEPSRTGSTRPSPEDQTTPLALVFNEEKSAFILEKISAALDFNLTSAPSQSRADVQALPQLSSTKKIKEPIVNVDKPAAISSDDDGEDEDADPANPYDYRHFLKGAEANAEKGLGSRTPIPGVISGFPSPVPGASRFKTNSGPDTPVHKPIASAPSAQVKRRKISDNSSRDAAHSSTGSTQKNNATKPRTTALPSASTTSSSSSKPKPLSKARVSGSDEEIGDTITLSRPSKKPTATTAGSKAGYAASPRIEVDEAAGLVIDMGSPPPAARRRLGAGFASPFAIARVQPPRGRTSAAAHGTSLLDSEEEEEEEDAQGEPDDGVDVVMRDVNVGPDGDVDMDADGDVDGDVEDLVLGSPRASTTRAPSVSVSRVGADADRDDEDEDDELAAELEAALENDDEDGDGDGDGNGNGSGSRGVVGVGLGISTGVRGGGGVGEGEDESEVSEEE